ncbi:MAG: hypothetical protein ACTSQN_05565 [Candidatus Heimdallarchaeota archaeon]
MSNVSITLGISASILSAFIEYTSEQVVAVLSITSSKHSHTTPSASLARNL